MKVKYVIPYEDLPLQLGQEYDVDTMENGFYRISVASEGTTTSRLYSPQRFEVVSGSAEDYWDSSIVDFFDKKGITQMSLSAIVDAMWDSPGKQIEWYEKNGDRWTGFVDTFESAFDNSDDEFIGASLCVERCDSYNIILFENEIYSIRILY